MLAQQVFFPLSGICRHVYRHFKTQFCRHDAYAQAQIACGAHGDAVGAEKRAPFFVCQHSIIIVYIKTVCCPSQAFSMFQHLVYATAGFDGARNGQVAVTLEQQAACKLTQGLLHGGDVL